MVVMLLSGCVSRQKEAASTVEEYLQALANHDSNQVSNLSCRAWEMDALTEVDSFQLVSVTLEEVQCAAAGETPDGFEVQCGGKIVTTYNNEIQSIDLEQRLYLVRQEYGDWFVCGYR